MTQTTTQVSDAALLRGKTTDKEREKEQRRLLDTLSCRRNKDREWLFILKKE